MRFVNVSLSLLLILGYTNIFAQRIPIAAIPDWVEKRADFEMSEYAKQLQEGSYDFTKTIYQEIQVNVDTEEIFYKSIDRIASDKPVHNVSLGHSPKDDERKIIKVSLKKGDNSINLTKKLNWNEQTSNEYIVNKLWESYKVYSFSIDRLSKGDLYSISYLDKSLRDDISVGTGIAYSFPDSSVINFRVISCEPLHFKAFNGFPKVEVVQHDSYFEYRAEGFAITPYKGSTPRDFISVPFICFSKFEKIEEMGHLFKDQFLVDERSETALDNLYADLTKDATNDSIKIKNIVNYVQDTILYQDYGLIKSYQPYWCILGNRGDCKAKSLITIELLKRAGIKAYPIIVNSPGYFDQLDAIPSVVNFDHVITQFVVGTDTILLDPTRTEQTDKIGGYPIPDFEKGLAIYGDEVEVIDMTAQNRGKITIHDTISDRVQREIILSGEKAEMYRENRSYFGNVESLFRQRLYRAEEINRAIHPLSEYSFRGALVSELEKEYYNSTSEDAIVLTQEMYFPDSLKTSFLPTEKCQEKDLYGSVNIVGSIFSEMDSSYTGNWPLDYINQSTVAVYDKEMISFKDFDLNTVETNFIIEKEFGHYKCSISENDSHIIVKQDILVSGSLPISHMQELSGFENSILEHMSSIYNLLIVEEVENTLVKT